MKPKEVFEKALVLQIEKEKLYGKDSWQELGLSGCIEAAVRKAVYLKAQQDNGLAKTEKFSEDLLDLINWAAFAYCLRQGT